jgi:hypothetical protein
VMWCGCVCVCVCVCVVWYGAVWCVTVVVCGGLKEAGMLGAHARCFTSKHYVCGRVVTEDVSKSVCSMLSCVVWSGSVGLVCVVRCVVWCAVGLLCFGVVWCCDVCVVTFGVVCAVV